VLRPMCVILSIYIKLSSPFLPSLFQSISQPDSISVGKIKDLNFHLDSVTTPPFYQVQTYQRQHGITAMQYHIYQVLSQPDSSSSLLKYNFSLNSSKRERLNGVRLRWSSASRVPRIRAR